MSIPFTGLAQVADAASVPYCRGIRDGQYCGDPRTREMDHRRGFIDAEGRVHMADRRLTRSTLRTFCLLAADAEMLTLTEYDDAPPWLLRFERCRRASEIARTRLHVRIPSSHWNLDRWTVKAQLANVDPGTPRRDEALTWAKGAT